MRGPLQLPPWPRVPRRLGLTAGAWLLCALNLLALDELWLHTPAARPWLLLALWLLTLLLLPQLAMLGWRWLRAWELPGLLRLLCSAAYLGGLTVLVGIWFVILFGCFPGMPW